MAQPTTLRLVTEATNATTSAADRNRVNHTGTQSADTLTDGTTNKAFLATERTKLAGIAAGATVNRADTATDAAIAAATAALVGSAPGTLDTLGELAAALTADEGTAATLATLVGTKAPLASPALTGTPTINGTAVAKVTDIPAGYSDEQAQDAAAALFTGGTMSGITFTYDDAGNRINATVTPGAVADATTTSKGAVQLAGDLAGTAAAPTVPGLAGKAPLASPTFTGTVGGITAAMVGADAAGAATTAQAASLQKTSNLADLNNAATARTNLGLGTAATAAATAFEAAGAVAAIRLGGTVNAITTNATAVIGVRNTVNAAAGPITVTLPTPTVVGQQLVIERADASATNTITITGTIRGVSNATATLTPVGVANEGATWTAESLTSWIPSGSIKPKAFLDASYAAKPTGTPAAGTYVDGATNAWTALPTGSGGGATPLEGLAVIKPPIGGAISSPITNTSGQAPAIGTLHLGMLYLPGGTYSTVICRVNSPIAGATVKMVAYKADPNNILGTLLFDTAAVAATNGGYLSIALPTALVVADPGYPIWVGLVNQGTAAANFWYGSAGLGLPYIYSAGGSADLNNSQPLGVALTGVTGAAPTSPTGVTTSYLGGAPRIALLRSA